ncbi:hypothetical protein ACHWQZ_G003391 [Mnemiopsis leidyi]
MKPERGGEKSKILLPIPSVSTLTERIGSRVAEHTAVCAVELGSSCPARMAASDIEHDVPPDLDLIFIQLCCKCRLT